MSELHRILRPGGIFLARMPYFRYSSTNIDTTNVGSFTINMMNFFIVGTYCDEGYRFSHRSLNLYDVFLNQDYPSTLIRHLLTPLAIAKLFRYENSVQSSINSIEQASYVLTK